MRTLGDLSARVPETAALWIAMNIVYIAASWVVLRRSRGLPAILVCAAVFRLTAWPIYPSLSDDVFRYRWEGQVQLAGGNPYAIRPAEAGRDAAYSRIPGPAFRAVYGPVLEATHAATQFLIARGTGDPFAQAFWHKTPGALADLGVVAALLLLLRSRNLPPERVLLYVWSPLPVMEFWANGHHDSIVILFLVLALAAHARARSGWAFTALGLAAAAKWWPALLAGTIWDRAKSRCALLLPAIVAACSIPYWTGAAENVRFASGFIGGWRNNDSLYGVLLWITGDVYRAKYLAFVCIAAFALYFARRPWPAEKRALATVIALLAFSANCHPWYLTWFLPLLALYPWRPLLLWTALAPIGYDAVTGWRLLGEWNGSSEIRWLVYTPVAGLTILSGMLNKLLHGSTR